MAAPNPLLKAFVEPPKHVSRRDYTVAGLAITIYGLEELKKEEDEIACLWLLHPRLGDRTRMEPLAYSAINTWNEHLSSTNDRENKPGLIAIAFDQRNHGSRKIDDLATKDWMSGNEKHAQDMFATYHGTALDASLLLTYVPSYVFPQAEHTVVDNFVCGVSLGGHAAWHFLMDDPRVSAAIIVVGCPDYITLMSARARQSSLDTAGPSFLGSKDFPEHLLEAVGKHDPAGQLIGIDSTRAERFYREPISNERAEISSVFYRAFKDKRILNLAGGADRLVPYSCAAPFLQWLKRTVAPGGSFDGTHLEIDDFVEEGAGHALTPEMVKRINSFLVELAQKTSTTGNSTHKL